MLAVAPELLGDWSAPLDDVFIHFDFARATARGHPFQWSEGNGYSSGGTSLLYPFVLALGYWIWSGFRGLDLMVWAAIVACVSVFGACSRAAALFSGLPRWASYFAPPALLGRGRARLDAFQRHGGRAVPRAVWGVALIAWDDLLRVAPRTWSRRARLGDGIALGLASAVLVATRPGGGDHASRLRGERGAFVVRRARGPRRS